MFLDFTDQNVKKKAPQKAFCSSYIFFTIFYLCHVFILASWSFKTDINMTKTQGKALVW